MPSTSAPSAKGETVLTTVQMPRDLRDWLQRHAKRHQRSMAAEVRYLVEQHRDKVEREEAQAA